MKLNTQAKDELRAKIIEQLKNVPKGQRVNLEKELLEDLLFEVITLDKEKDIKVKLPVWSGWFLSKIDLSQVDFSNVSWSMLDPSQDIGYLEYIDGISVDENVFDRIDKIRTQNIDERYDLGYGFLVSYAGTNANIDLTKSFEAIYRKYIEIRECNFEGVDFSQLDLSGLKGLYLNSSSISQTKLTIPSDIELTGHRSFFTNIDLSSREIDAYEYFFEDTYNLSRCDLENTGIRIKLDVEKFKDGTYKEDLQEVMGEDWVGCYVNGKKIKSVDERQAIAQEKNAEYEKMKEDLISATMSSIEQQTSGFGRK